MKPNWCSGLPWIYGQLEKEGSICHGYMCMLLYMKPLWCNCISEIYAQLEGGVNMAQVDVHAPLYATKVV